MSLLDDLVGIADDVRAELHEKPGADDATYLRGELQGILESIEVVKDWERR